MRYDGFSHAIGVRMPCLLILTPHPVIQALLINGYSPWLSSTKVIILTMPFILSLHLQLTAKIVLISPQV